MECPLVTLIQVVGDKDVFMTLGQYTLQSWLKSNVAINVSQSLPKAEIDAVSSDELATCCRHWIGQNIKVSAKLKIVSLT
jgi:hypothetical protein